MSSTTADHNLAAATARLLADLNPRARSLIVTVFGDAIAPRGGEIWLGDLIALMAPFGLSERLVRTCANRLAHEGWLDSRASGRRSYYRLTRRGEAVFAAAAKRIYARHGRPWDGTWLLVHLIGDIAAGKRKDLRTELTWQGFGWLSPSVFIRPNTSATTSAELARRLPGGDNTLLFTARLLPGEETTSAAAVAANAWDLRRLNDDYESLLARFSPWSDVAPEHGADSFVLRILLIHEYRRILLRDPVLPDELLPPQWAGKRARQLTARIYLAIAAQAEDWLDRTTATALPASTARGRFMT